MCGEHKRGPVFAVVIDNSVVIDNILSVHLQSFRFGAGAMHAVSDDDNDILSFHTGLLDNLH